MTTLALLAGGASTRMGRDKAGMLIGGQTALHHLAALGLAAGLPVVVCGRVAPPDWSLPKVRFVSDAQPGQGPLRGLEAALAVDDDVLATACDLPALELDAITWICAQVSAEHGVSTIIDGHLQPLFSRFTVACLPLIQKELSLGRRSPMAVIRSGTFTVAMPPLAIARQLADADTPDDWQRLVRS